MEKIPWITEQIPCVLIGIKSETYLVKSRSVVPGIVGHGWLMQNSVCVCGGGG